MSEIYLLNGKVKSKKEIYFSTLKRGFLYGDGIFETLISRNFKIFRFSEHYNRLKKGAEICNLEIKSKKEIEETIQKHLKKFNIKNGYIRINLWRKTGKRVIPEGKKANTLIIIKKYMPYPSSFYRNGIICIISKKIFRSAHSISNNLKSLNFLENILGKIEAKENGCEETIFLNTDGFITETTVSNIFFVRDNKVYTPSPECGILEGITRKTVIGICRKNKIKVVEGKFYPEILSKCSEVFLTNTLMGIMPVKSINGFFKKRKTEITDFIKSEYLKILKEETG